MKDIESAVYALLTECVPEIEWSAGYSQSQKCGAIKQMKNNVKISSSSSLEHIVSAAIQVQFGVNTPEERFPLEEKISDAIKTLGLKRGSVNHLEDVGKDNTVLFRCVMMFDGFYDELEDKFYFYC